MEYYLVRSDDHLEHHGILGMKWGVRRYQNPDGTLTTEGKKRRQQLETYRDEQRSTSRSTSKSRSTMSDAELVKRIERLELEKKLKNLENETAAKGQAYIEDILKSVGKKTAVQIGTGVAIGLAEAALSGDLDIKEIANAIKDMSAKEVTDYIYNVLKETGKDIAPYIAKPKDKW